MTSKSQVARRKDSDGRGAKAPGNRRSDERKPQMRAAVRTIAPAPVTDHPVFALLPYAFVMAIISAVFVWDYTVKPKRLDRRVCSVLEFVYDPR